MVTAVPLKPRPSPAEDQVVEEEVRHVTSASRYEALDQPSLSNGGTSAPLPSPVAVRVRSRLGVMLMMVVVAACVAGAALGLLVAGREPTVAIAAAAVVLAVVLLIGVAIVAERRRLRRETASPPTAPTLTVVHPSAPASAGNGTDWIAEPAGGAGGTQDVRDQADLLEEILHWHTNGA